MAEVWFLAQLQGRAGTVSSSGGAGQVSGQVVVMALTSSLLRLVTLEWRRGGIERSCARHTGRAALQLRVCQPRKYMAVGREFKEKQCTLRVCGSFYSGVLL